MKELSNSNLPGWARILLFIIPYLMVVGTFQLIGYALAGVELMDSGPDEKLGDDFLIIEIFILTGTVLVIWIFRRFVDKGSFLSLGLSIKGRSKDILFGLLMGGVVMASSFLVLLVTGNIVLQGVEFDFRDFALSVGLFLMVALGEELLIRGYVLSNLMRSFNKYIALTVSSILFALMHYFNPHANWFNLGNLALAGVLLGLYFVYHKNLWFPIALHFSWNFFQGTVLGFNVSGLECYGLIIHEQRENNIWNGGEFGLEGSLLIAVSVVICIFIIVRKWRPMKFPEKGEGRTMYPHR